MQNIYDIIKNVEGIYESNTAFQVLKDFERVLDELDIYVYKNWEDGELAEGPIIDRHWITCKFFWPRAKMPDPMGGKRLLDYDCKISYEKSHIAKPSIIGRLDREAKGGVGVMGDDVVAGFVAGILSALIWQGYLQLQSMHIF